VAMAAELRSSVRPQDLVGRLGGDEFAVFAAGMDCEALLERIDSAVGGLGSAGTAPLTGPERLQEALLVADTRMYEAKRARTTALQ
ncbi:MAG TPA: diguanylate cyclase, partial [Nocardioides sp.]|nr:diguanylate cyclase [Nocardioides sp.]